LPFLLDPRREKVPWVQVVRQCMESEPQTSMEQRLAQSLGRLRHVVQRLLRGSWGCEDLVSNLQLRLSRALAAGVVVRSYDAFFLAAWPEELQQWRREQARWRRWAGSAAAEDGLGAAEALAELTEAQVRAVGVLLPSPLGGWLVDWLSGAADETLAARDGVAVAAIRKRWSRLRAYIEQPSVLERIMDFPVTKQGGPAPIGVDGVGPVDSGAPPNPEPRTPNPEPRTADQDNGLP
jgi:hypothetical protein